MKLTFPRTTPKSPVASRVLILTLYGILTAIGLYYHEPWRDETHSWLIAHLSASISDLYQNIRYEGHPSLWYLLAWLVKPVSESFSALQVIHWFMSLGAAYLLLTYAPFSLRIRVLLLFSYFLFYEYTIIARNYAVGVLLLFLICAHFDWRHRPNRFIGFCLLFVLLFQTNAFAALIGIALFGVVGLEGLLHHWRTIRQHPLPYAIGIGLVGLGLLASLLTILPPADINLPPSPLKGWHPWVITYCVETIWNAFVPIPARWPAFRNTNVLELITAFKLRTAVRLGLSVAVVIGVVVPLFRSRLTLSAWVLICLGILYILITQYVGSLRHHGHFALSALVLLWIQPQLVDYQVSQPAMAAVLPAALTNRLTRLAYPSMLGVLIVQAAVGLLSYATDLTHPFTSSQRVARYILSGPARTWFWSGYTSDIAESVAIYLPDFRMYYPMNGQHGGFLKYDKSIHRFGLARIVDSVGHQTRRPALLILNEPVAPDSLRLLHLSPVAEFKGSIQREEDLYLYRYR